MAICGEPCQYDEQGGVVDMRDPDPPLCGQSLGHAHDVHVPWGSGFWFVQGLRAAEETFEEDLLA